MALRDFVSIDLKDLERRLKEDPELRAKAAAMVGATTIVERCWLPQLGPQYEAYHTEADETLYGGAAGGGKSDLIVGLATTAHERTLIFRRQATDLDGIWERLIEVLEERDRIRTKNSVKKRLETTDDRVVEMGHLEQPGSEKSWQGRPHDLIAFDEAAQLDEAKVQFVTRWLRTTTEGQRCRVIFATNPPMPDLKKGQSVDSSTGDWLKSWFEPWLNTELPVEKRAKSGDIRWCFMVTEGDRFVTVWVDGPGWYKPETQERWPDDNPSEETIQTEGLSKARSRTFIRSLVSDNRYLSGSGYVERLSGTPEPLRSMLLHGSFTVKGQDHKAQVIPTQWVLLAQQRWRARREQVRIDPTMNPAPMRVLAADVAQGGADSTVLAALREDHFFDELVVRPGSQTPDGPTVVAELLIKRRDAAMLVIDMTGGWGISTRDNLRDNHQIEARACVASSRSSEWTRDMSLSFLNVRAEMWWKFREALDPDNGFNVMLPPDDRLLSQLTAPHFGVRGRDIVIESKDDVRKRVGSSTDEADAVIMAWRYLPLAMAEAVQADPVAVADGGWTPGAQQPRDEVMDIDPLADW